MTGGAWIRSALIAVLFGSIWPFILNQLFAFSGRVTVPLIRTLADLGIAENVPLAVRLLNAVIWALVLGVLFGVPLGLAVRKNLIAYWFVFVGSVLTVSAAIALHADSGLGILLLEWSLPETWIHIFAVLGVGYLAARFRNRRERAGVVAP
jgi:hypothetical protein